MRKFLGLILAAAGALAAVYGVVFALLAYARSNQPGGDLAQIGVAIGALLVIFGLIALATGLQVAKNQEK